MFPTFHTLQSPTIYHPYSVLTTPPSRGVRKLTVELNVTLVNGDDLSIPLEPGKPLFVLGPNGSGKSSLIQHAATTFGGSKVRRMSAHRQTWLESASINMTASDRKQFDETLAGREANPIYRWREYDGGSRVSSVLFDLNAKQTELALRIMDYAYAKDLAAIGQVTEKETPVFDQINELLVASGLPVTIENSLGEAILARHRGVDSVYDMAQMSDGERSAVILAANVLTVKPGTILLLDEPERHLHQAVSEPFLSALFAMRPDCPAVITTHDISLPMANQESPVLMIWSCRWGLDNAVVWDGELLKEHANIPEEFKRIILGSRRITLFVEGNSGSPDVQLYSSLFPGITVTPLDGCEKVIDAVVGLRNSSVFHDVQAFGLIDGDNRCAEEKADLRSKGIYALDCYSVESILYCLDAIGAVSERQALSLGENGNDMLLRVKNGLHEALASEDLAERMAARRCERRVREQVQSRMPTWRSILEKESYSIEIDTTVWHQQELDHYKSLLQARDLDGIVARYPVRESNAIDEIVKPLHLSRENYRKTLLSLVRQDPSLADRLRARIAPLVAAIDASE